MDVLEILEQIGFRLSFIESDMLRVKEMLKDVRIAYKDSEPELWEQESYNE